MGGVNLANQYRAAYETHKSIRRNWFCVLLALLDITVVNSYRISYINAQQQDMPNNQLPKQADFHIKLYMHLFSFFDDPELVQRRKCRGRLSDIQFNTLIVHESVVLPKRVQCVQCAMDITLEKRQTGIARRVPRGVRSCAPCNVALCVKGPCWQRYHTKE